MAKKGKVLISFDVEEFDLPREHGGEISLEEGVRVSSGGLAKILDLLKRRGVKATFFVTGNFATVNPEMVRRIAKEGHEVACHGVDHFEPKETDAGESKRIVEKVAGVRVQGYRQPRMGKISYEELKKNGYKYDSSVNPAFVPGRYNHFGVPRKVFLEGGVVEIPTSVATGARVPLFWLALHLLPKRIYLGLARGVIKKTGYLATYFHPWEFADELARDKKVPFYIKKNSGDKILERLDYVITRLKNDGCEFEGYGDFVKKMVKK